MELHIQPSTHVLPLTEYQIEHRAQVRKAEGGKHLPLENTSRKTQSGVLAT